MSVPSRVWRSVALLVSLAIAFFAGMYSPPRAEERSVPVKPTSPSTSTISVSSPSTSGVGTAVRSALDDMTVEGRIADADTPFTRGLLQEGKEDTWRFQPGIGWVPDSENPLPKLKPSTMGPSERTVIEGPRSLRDPGLPPELKPLFQQMKDATVAGDFEAASDLASRILANLGEAGEDPRADFVISTHELLHAQAVARITGHGHESEQSPEHYVRAAGVMSGLSTEKLFQLLVKVPTTVDGVEIGAVTVLRYLRDVADMAKRQHKRFEIDGEAARILQETIHSQLGNVGSGPSTLLNEHLDAAHYLPPARAFTLLIGTIQIADPKDKNGAMVAAAAARSLEHLFISVRADLQETQIRQLKGLWDLKTREAGDSLSGASVLFAIERLMMTTMPPEQNGLFRDIMLSPVHSQEVRAIAVARMRMSDPVDRSLVLQTLRADSAKPVRRAAAQVFGTGVTQSNESGLRAMLRSEMVGSPHPEVREALVQSVSGRALFAGRDSELKQDIERLARTDPEESVRRAAEELLKHAAGMEGYRRELEDRLRDTESRNPTHDDD